MKYVIDTHAWIWWTAAPNLLSRKIRMLLAESAENRQLLLSAMSIWEFCKLVEKRRLNFTCDPAEWIEESMSLPGVILAPLSPRIALEATTLPPGLHSDPVDQIIAATARVEGAVLITKDERLTRYEHVKTIW